MIFTASCLIDKIISDKIHPQRKLYLAPSLMLHLVQVELGWKMVSFLIVQNGGVDRLRTTVVELIKSSPDKAMFLMVYLFCTLPSMDLDIFQAAV